MIKKYLNFDLTNDKWQTTMTQDKIMTKDQQKNNDTRQKKWQRTKKIMTQDYENTCSNIC